MRLIVGSICVAFLIILAAGGSIWWRMTHVRTVQATVNARVVSLATDVDAHMAELRVVPGQQVAAGEVLARLDDSALKASLAGAKAEREIMRSACAQAKANAGWVQKQVDAEIALAKTRLEIAACRVAKATGQLELRKKEVPVEIQRAQALRDEALARLEYLKRGAREERVEVARARLETARARASLAAYQVKQIETLVERRVESELELEVARTDLAARKNEAREAELVLSQLVAGPTTDQIEAATQALEAREAALSLAGIERQSIDLLSAELSMRRAERQEAEVGLQREMARTAEAVIAREQVKAAAAKLEKAEAQVAQDEAALRKMTIVSPVAGTVIRTFDQVGEVCRKGLPTILVADDSAGRWIEGFVTEDEAGLIQIGQKGKAEVIVGSGTYLDVVVEAVGLSTSAIGRGEGGGQSMQQRGTLVWVKLQPVSPAQSLLPGNTARAVIRVRGGTD